MERPWPQSPLDRFGLGHPIVQAPMAGGPTTPAMAAAAAEAGCLGFLAGAYLTPDGIRAAAAEVRQLTQRPFGINLFLPETATASEEAIARMNAVLDTFRRPLGLPLSPPLALPKADFAAQIEAVLDVRPAMASFTFGCPSRELVARLQAAGIAVAGTATCVREAVALDAVGVDVVVAQGAEAGGHRGTFPETPEDAMVGTFALVPQVASRIRVPVIAAGGVMDGRGIVAALALGACGVQMGTAFLATRESGAAPVYRKALLGSDDEATTLTRAFSGRWARGLRNRFIREMAPHAPLPFPLQNVLTRDLRQAAAKAGEADLLSLWAGQASALTREGSISELVSAWHQEAAEVLARLCPEP